MANDIVKEQVYQLLSQPRVMKSGMWFQKTDLIMALEQQGFQHDFADLETLVFEALNELTREGKLESLGSMVRAKTERDVAMWGTVTSWFKKLLARSAQPQCKVCGRTHAQVKKDEVAAGRIPIGLMVGICPVCKQAYCIRHAPYDSSFDVDSVVCPIHQKALNLNWANSSSGIDV